MQSRYYDPVTHRFINADSYASTGQGIVGTNMFTYCLNNPVIFADPAGTRVDEIVPLFTTWEEDLSYITDQEAAGLGEQLLSSYSSISATVAHGGCGVIATYNANIALGRQIPFEEVLSFYQQKEEFTLFGWLGMMPSAVVAYFEDAGYTVVTTDDPYEIDIFSQFADACIMWYLFEYDNPPWIGGHFAQYQRDGTGYVAHNVGSTGVYYFNSPSKYADQGRRFYALVIFVFEQ